MTSDLTTDGGSSDAAAVALQDIGKSFGETEVLKKVSFHARKGEFLTLLGPSGCGKTTSLRIIAGFEEATSGDVMFGQTSVNDLPPWRRDIGLVFQNYALFPYMTAAENVAFGLKMRRVSKAETATRVKAALAQVGLAGYETRHPRHLSGGQRQRVALARALVIEPKLLLLDEPLSNLDAKLRGEMRYELKNLQRATGVTTIFVTHDQEEAFSLSDRIVLMRSGEIVQYCAPDELWSRPATAFAADFIGVENLIPAHVTAPGQLTCAGGLAVTPTTVGFAPGAEVILGLRASDVKIQPRGGTGLPATILDGEYRGRERLYRLAVPGLERPVLASAPSDIAFDGEVTLCLPPEKMMVLHDDR